MTHNGICSAELKYLMEGTPFLRHLEIPCFEALVELDEHCKTSKIQPWQHLRELIIVNAGLAEAQTSLVPWNYFEAAPWCSIKCLEIICIEGEKLAPIFTQLDQWTQLTSLTLSNMYLEQKSLDALARYLMGAKSLDSLKMKDIRSSS